MNWLHILVVSLFFGIGWEIGTWYRVFEAKSCRPSVVRLIRDGLIAALLAAPMAVVAIALLSNTAYLGEVIS